jgi:hypothetical protein
MPLERKFIIADWRQVPVLLEELHGPQELVLNPSSGRLRARPEFQVLEAVVALDPVLVVDFFVTAKVASKVLLHEQTVLEHPPRRLGAGYVDVPLLGNEASGHLSRASGAYLACPAHSHVVEQAEGLRFHWPLALLHGALLRVRPLARHVLTVPNIDWCREGRT